MASVVQVVAHAVALAQAYPLAQGAAAGVDEPEPLLGPAGWRVVQLHEAAQAVVVPG